MTLSEIIAKEGSCDKQIPDKGYYKVFLVIQDGRVELRDVTEQWRREPRVKG